MKSARGKEIKQKIDINAEVIKGLNSKRTGLKRGSLRADNIDNKDEQGAGLMNPSVSQREINKANITIGMLETPQNLRSQLKTPTLLTTDKKLASRKQTFAEGEE